MGSLALEMGAFGSGCAGRAVGMVNILFLGSVTGWGEDLGGERCVVAVLSTAL